MQQLLNSPVTRHALNALLTPFYFLFQPKKRLLRFALLVMSVGIMSGVAGQATVTSDKDDYAPRSNAVFTGAGFQAFEQVQLKVKNLNSPCNTVTTDSSYLPWSVTADANGAFVTNWTVCDCPGDSLRLKAIGLTSGLIAYAYFTDGNVEFKTTGLPTGSGVSVSYDYFPTGSGAPTLTAGSNTTDFTLVSRNNQLVRFSYPLSVIIAGELYNRTNVSINSGTLLSGTNGFEFQFESPNASRIVTATYVICPKPVINTQPVSQTITYGAPTVSFTSTATNATDKKWQVNTGSGFNDIVPAETATTLTISNPTVAMSGYQYRMVATGSCGSTNSNIAILTVNKANATVNVSGYTGVYDGNAHGATGSATGVNGESLAGLDLGVSFTNVPGGTANWTFTDVTGNYNNTSGSVAIVISKAPSVTTVTINGGPFTYSGSAITPATVSVTGAGGVLASPSAVYANNVNAGTATASYNYAGDVNHEPSSDSKNFTIDKANATINVSGYTGVYDGNAHGATGTATGVNGESLSGLDLGASFTNVPGGTASWTFTDVTGNYNNTSGSVQIVISKANATISVNGYSGVYDGNAHGATGTATGVNGESLSGLDLGASFTNVPGGTANWTFTDVTGNYNNTSGSVAIVISKAPSVTTVTINGGPFTYSGSAITPATVSVTGAGGVVLATPTASYSNNINAGTATASYSYAGDANHEPSSDSKNFTIDKANATVNVSGYSGVYDGNAHGATGTATGVNGESLSGLDLGASFTNVPGGTASWTFTDATGNYNNANGSVAIVISKAPSVTTVTINGDPFTYSGSAITPATVSVTGAGGVLASPSAVYANNVNAGTATASYNYAGDVNHEPSSDSKNFTIDKANATISVNGYSGVYDGNAHGATGTATGVNGESLSGLDLGASFTNVPGGTASWTFTDVTGNYNNASGSVAIVISKANATVNVSGYTGVYDGNAHGATGSATGVNGESLSGLDLGASFTNVPGGTASWTFTDVTGNYNNTSGSVAIVISKAPSVTTVTINGGPFIYTGSAITPATVSVTGAGGVVLASPSAVYANNVNAGTATASYSYVGDGNHEPSSDSKNFTIDKANAIVNVSGYTGVYDGNAHGATGSATGVNGESLAGLDLGASFTNVPGGTANWTFTDVTGNYNNTSGSVAIVISKAPSVTTVTINGGPFIYSGSAITPATVSVTGAGGVVLATPTASYSNNINAGTATASYNYAGDGNHEPSSDSKNFTIDKANATVNVSGYTGVYDGNPHGATGTATGVNGESLAGLDLGASFTNVPGGTASWTFTDVTGNYNNTSGSVQVSISTKPASVTPNASSKYCGQADPVFTGTLSGFLGVDNVIPTYTRTAGETVAGSPYTISATLTGVLSNYNITYNTAAFTINGVTIDASASSATVPIGQTARLKAVVTDGITGVEGVAVKFEIKNSAGTVIQTKYTTSLAGGLIDIAADALTLGVYQVIATAGNGCGTSTAYITMYDANENFVTGGGWISSPAGALTADPSVVGKANFGFVSKYKKGSSQVDGNTEFQFNAGNINFKSTMHESGSLVISGGKATYRGSGTVNGNTGYKFVIVAMDGNWNNGFNPDKFRIKITTTTGQTVYDNQMNSAENADDATILGGGSIVIHETKKKTSNRMDPGTLILTPQEFAVKVFGNPSLSSFRLQLQSSDLFTKFTVKVVDVNGRLMEVKENLYAGQVIELGAAYKQGVYFAEVMQGSNRKVVQLIKAGKE